MFMTLFRNFRAILFVCFWIPRKTCLKCRWLGTTQAYCLRMGGPRNPYLVGFLDDSYAYWSLSLMLCVLYVFGDFCVRDGRGMPQWHPKMNKDQRWQKWWPAKLFKPIAWGKENASTFPGNYSFSLYIYNSYVISLSNNIIYVYIMGLACVQVVEKQKGGESISFLYFPMESSPWIYYL